MRFDWTFKVADVIKIVIMIVVGILAYAHMEQRVSNVEKLATQTADTLAEHIKEQNEATIRLNQLLDRMQIILEDYPPHRHEQGKVIYPLINHNGVH